MIEARGVSKLFPVGKKILWEDQKHVHAVNDVDLSIKQGRSLALVGESGSGKTTLGRLCSGLAEPTSGSIYFDGVDISKIDRDERRVLRSQLQFIFQDPYSSLNPRHNIRTILARPFEIHTSLSHEVINEKIKELLQQVQLVPPETLMNRYPHQFSGGQRQRLVFARAIALHPKFIVADEPVSSVDMSVKAQLLTLLRQFQVEFNLTYLFITHELSVVRTIAQDVAVMYLGHIVELGPAKEIFDGPLHPYTYALLTATPILDPEKARAREHITLTGTMPSPTNLPTGCYFHTRCPYFQDVCKQKIPEYTLIGQRQVGCHFVGNPNFPLTSNIPSELKSTAEESAKAYSAPNNST